MEEIILFIRTLKDITPILVLIFGCLSVYYYSPIDLLAILQKSLDGALFLYNFIREVRSNGVRGSFTIMHIRKFFKMHHNIVRFRFFP